VRRVRAPGSGFGAMSMHAMSVMEPVRAAIAFARANVMRVAGVLGVLMLLNIGAVALARETASWLLFALGLIVGLMAQGALLRLAFAEEHPDESEFRIGPFGFQFGRPEMNLLMALGLLVFLMLLAMLLLLFLTFMFTIAAYGLGHASVTPPGPGAKLPPEVQLIVSVLMFLFGLAVIWVGVRVCLYPAATVAERKVKVFSVWKMTEGRFWPILAAILILAAPALLLELAAMAVSGPGLQLALAFVSAAVNAFVEAPLLFGLYAVLYKRLRALAPPVGPATGAIATGPAGPWG
jgi:Ca2+/Na+ antiporter